MGGRDALHARAAEKPLMTTFVARPAVENVPVPPPPRSTSSPAPPSRRVRCRHYRSECRPPSPPSEHKVRTARGLHPMPRSHRRRQDR